MPDPGLPALSPLLLLGGWACGLLLIDAFVPTRRKGITAALAAAGLLASLVLLVSQPRPGVCAAPGEAAACFSGVIRVDGFAVVLQALVLVTSLTVIALGFDYLQRTGLERGEF